MRKITGKHLLCFFLFTFTLSCAENARKTERKTQNSAVLSQGRIGGLFARQKTPPQERHIPKNKINQLTPAHRCSQLMESCSPVLPCCNPCASCRCRLFNTICNCWKMNSRCLKKT